MTNKNYKGSLRLDWINKNLSLYYEIDEKEGKGVRPVWVPKNDIRVAEPRILRFDKSFGDVTSENMLIKGDNLLVLRSLVEMFKGKPEQDKIKCIYIDPPYNTGSAFERYDDNLQHSEWLTMMRDRLHSLKKLLKKDGHFWISIDDLELHYLKILLDEVMGRENFITTICIKTSSINGLRTKNNKPTKVKDYLLLYARDVNYFKFQQQFELDENVEHYNIWLQKDGGNVSQWKVFPLKKIILEKYKAKDLKDIPEWKINKFILNNKENVYSSQPVADRLDRVAFANENPSKLREYVNPDGSKLLMFKKRILDPFQKKFRNIDGETLPAKLVGDLWTDINYTGIDKEGGVKFANGKKPEKLLMRILQSSTKEGDLVLDSFLGSGTTVAVAQKMNRRWIGVEMGSHYDSHCLPRLKSVINGKDKSGITEATKWREGGGFKSYQLGESLINEQDMNWVLKAEEMAAAIFLHFQYKSIKADWLEKENMYLGKHQSARYHFALAFASRELKTLNEEIYDKVTVGLDKEKFKHLTIFTNVAVVVPPESLDDRVFIKKIPAAILREYNLL